MSYLKRVFSYLVNPRSGYWRFSESDEEIEPRKVPWKGIFNPPFVVGSLIVLVLIFIVWFGPTLASYDPYITSRTTPSYYDAENQVMVRPPFDPSPEYPLGTDRFGNDILSLIYYGARITLLSCLYITAGRVFLGLVMGGLAGWTEGSRFDRFMTRMSAVISSIPLLLSAMLMILALDITKGVWVFVVSLSVLGWTEIAQLVRGEFIRIKEMLYVEAAKALGLTKLQIIIRHALPNVLSYLISISFLEMGAVLLILAELGFLGLFVGGGSRFRSDPFSPVIIQISEIPEWGALVAQGTPNLRTYPYMILGPAAAFFIAILGLNAFGEGLRRIFDRWPFSTAILLKKQMVLIIAAFIGVSAFIFQKTNAAISYQQVAASFDEQRAVNHLEQLKTVNTISQASKENSVIEYIVERFREYEVQPGWSETLTSLHYYPITTNLVRPINEPRLQVGYRDRYQYINEFGFLTDGCAGSGIGQGPVVFLGGLSYDGDVELSGDEVEGKILMVLEEGISPGFIDDAAAQGAVGILLVTADAPPLSSQFEVNLDLDLTHCVNGEIPVFQIPNAAARSISAEAGFGWDELRLRAVQETFTLDLNLPGVMDLVLSEPEIVEVPNAIGFLGGYDIDHADEIVVIFTTFDGLGLTQYHPEGIPEADLEKIAVLLEIMNTWNESNLDPRRSVQFVIWGGEEVEGPFFELIYGLYEKNKLAAKVPTNMNPYLNTNPVKPAIWVEIGELSTGKASLAYSAQSTPFLNRLFIRAADAINFSVQADVPFSPGVNSGLPNIYIWEQRASTPLSSPDMDNYSQKGVLINRTLIQLLRDMKD